MSVNDSYMAGSKNSDPNRSDFSSTPLREEHTHPSIASTVNSAHRSKHNISDSSNSHHPNNSIDFSSMGTPSTNRTRPTSEIFFQTPLKQPEARESDQIDKAAEKWLADLELYQVTLEEMASVSLDKDFKDELLAIEQWFEVLSVGERTAALYALLQQTTHVQIRFFITVLQKLANRDPLTAALSPTNTDRNITASQQVDSQNQNTRSNFSPTLSRANAVTTNTESPLTYVPARDGTPNTAIGIISAPRSNSKLSGSPGDSIVPPFKSQVAYTNSTSLHVNHLGAYSPSLPSGFQPIHSNKNENTVYSGVISYGGSIPPNRREFTPWTEEIHRPKSADVATNQGFQQYKYSPLSSTRSTFTKTPPPTTSLSNSISQTSSKSLYPEAENMFFYEPSASWASLVNTPTSNISSPYASFSGSTTKINSEIASSTAMKLAALSTVNNRITLDSDVRKFRKRSINAENDDSATGSNNSSQHVGDKSDPTGIKATHTGIAGKSQNLKQELSYRPMVGPHQSPLTDRSTQIPLTSGNPYNYSNVGTSWSDPKGQGQMSGIQGHNRAHLNKQPTTSQNSNLQYSNLSMIQTPEKQQNYRNSPISAKFDVTDNNTNRVTINSSVGTSTPKIKSESTSVDMVLLQDTGAWLRSLRLHKYTENLKDLDWEEMVQLSDKDLETRGVNALGARRKLLKVFEQVKELQRIGAISE